MPDPLTLSLIGLGLKGAGAVGGLIGQRKDRKAAEKAAEETRRQDAYYNLLVAAGGGQPAAPTPVAPIPQVDYAGAVGELGGLVGQYGGIKRQIALDDQAQQDAKFLEQYRKDTLATRIPQGQTSPTLDIKGVAAPRTSGAGGGITVGQGLDILFPGLNDADTPEYLKDFVRQKFPQLTNPKDPFNFYGGSN